MAEESSTGARAESVRAPVLVLGLGNDLISDDGFGPVVARACEAAGLAARPGVEIVEASVAGFHLLDLIQGRRRVLILDVVRTGQRHPGALFPLRVEEASAGRALGGSHSIDLATALELGRHVGATMPEEIAILVAEAVDLETIREELTPAVAGAVPVAVARVAAWLDGERV
ncbi:MAG: hydrogenase maturation protease [Candidatus Eisenbacteria bacterium]